MSEEEDAEKTLSKNLASATGGALVGAAIGGPIGAVVGGAVGPVAEYILLMRKRRLARAEALAGNAARLADMTVEDFFTKLTEKASISDLGLRLIELAAKHEQSDRDNAMALLLAKALKVENDKDLISYEIIADILADLRTPHIEILLFVQNARAQNPDSEVTPSDIINAFSDQIDIARSVIRTLELHGLILDENRLAARPTNEIDWNLSELGVALTDIIQNARNEAKKNE